MATKRRRDDLTGEKFGKWTVLGVSGIQPIKGGTKKFWKCQCECGNISEVVTSKLTTGASKSCGCLRVEVSKALKQPDTTKHGASGTPEYLAFVGAKYRCQNPKTKTYAYYGGRGIEFKFESFEQFLLEVGYRPSTKHSLDRKNNDGNYEPGNVRWATKKMQTSNTRRVNDLSQKIDHLENPLYTYALGATI